MRFPFALAAAFALAATLALGACSRAEPTSSSGSGACQPGDAGTPVDATLLAFLSSARAAHHIADEHEEAGDLPAAVAVLRKIVTGPVPGGTKPRPEAAEVLADTRARIADLESRTGQFDAADRDVADGLELAKTRSYFRGHLFEVRGLVEQRRAAMIAKAVDAGSADAGDAAAIAAAKQRAISAFEEAMRIQNEVIREAVPDGGDR